MIQTKIKVHFHSKQRVVWEALKLNRFVVLIAGRRFGKTILAIITLIIAALSHNESLYWYVAPSYRQAKMIAWKLIKSFTSFLKPKYNESELSVTFSNGSVIELKGAENEDSLRGTGLWGLVIDEFASIYNNWAVWNEVLRPALTDKKGWTLFIGTPKGKDALFELYIRGQHKDAGYLSFKYKTIDNPYIDPEEVEMAKQQMSERYFRQEYEASFEDFVGLVYPEFSQKAIIEPFYVQTHYSRIGAIDPAISGTTGVLKAFVDEKGRLVIYEEYYEQNVRVSEVAKIIRENSVRWFIDPSSAEKNIVKEGKLYSLYNEYSENDIRPIPAENDVEAGINRVAEYFKSGKIKVFSSCKNLIWELERYHWSEERETRTGMVKPKPYKKDDHLVDSLRYLVMSRMSKTEFDDRPLNPNSAWGQLQAALKEKEANEW